MRADKAFFDTNVLLYLLSADQRRADRAEELLAQGGVISVQVLNEFAAVAARRLAMAWSEIRTALDPIRAVCDVVPVTVETHERAVGLAEWRRWNFYDALIVAAALGAGCSVLYSEDLHDGQRIERSLTSVNPFASLR